MRPRVLLVEPDPTALARLRDAASFVADVDACPDFIAARARAVSGEHDFLVTNLRLEAYNGLHLVYLALSAQTPVRCIVYTERRDVHLAREVQDAGAFYELRDRLLYSFGAYVSGHLPPYDRRTPANPDRRGVFRGGRRSSDIPLLATS